ncbi:MAG: SCO family protein [Candidatus Tectomicrobia bacterium]|uniref:SCO family protein n=1 Tax=Tectimicrobiota bacterium TaxID=2528274 RepID=A0A933LQQ4_UNCTE|nr:SCO family protein [Candidatus Tectomicrobia bacterium]
MNMKKFFLGLAGVVLFSTVFAVGIYPLEAAPPAQKSLKETTASDIRRTNRFLNVVLYTHENKAVRFFDDLIKDKIVLINFIYVNCTDGICPPTTANLIKVQELLGERLGRDVFIYSITLDPEHDTPGVLKKYAETFGTKPGGFF